MSFPIFRRGFSVFVSCGILLCAVHPGHAEAAAPEPEFPTGLLTLREALDLALQRNPLLASYSWEVRAAEARILQAGLRPNPELALTVEEVRWNDVLTENSRGSGGGGTLSVAPLGLKPAVTIERAREEGGGAGFSESQFDLNVSQLIELGGKRAKRVRLARNEHELAQWDYEAARADVIESAATAFLNVLAAQARQELQAELVDLATQVHDTISRQVQAGEVSPLELNRAQVVLDSTLIEQERAARELAAARSNLTATWAQAHPTFERAVGRLDDIHNLPGLDALEAGITQNPDIARWATEMERRDTALTLARAQRIQNPTVGFGLRSTGIGARTAASYGFGTDGSFGFSRGKSDSESSRNNSLVLGFSVPLPLYNRNQGNIKEAEHLIQKSSEERRNAESSTFAALSETYQGISAASNEIRVLTKDILPKATETFEKIQEGYRQGKFGYLEVLDAERTLFDVRRQYLDALTAYHTQLVRLERLSGLTLLSSETPPMDSTEELDNHGE